MIVEETIVTTQGRPMSPYDEIRVVDEDDVDVNNWSRWTIINKRPIYNSWLLQSQEHNAKAFTKDGFYRTGDLVRVTELGNIIVEGRDKDQINRGGEKIAAEEVENHLLANEDVHDVAIVSMPDEYLGERSCAFVILRNQNTTKGALKKFLRERGIAAFKIPDRIEFIDSFPYTPLGKVSKKILRQMIAEKLEQIKLIL